MLGKKPFIKPIFINSIVEGGEKLYPLIKIVFKRSFKNLRMMVALSCLAKQTNLSLPD